MYKVKNREEFWYSRDSESGSSQPSPSNVKAVIEPFLKKKGIKVFNSIGNGNMSSVFKGKILSTNKEVILKAIGVKDDYLSALGFIIYDRVCKKEESSIKRLNSAGANVVKLIDSMECPINYLSFMDKTHCGDKIVIFVLEKLVNFSDGRGKDQKMTYNKIVKKWCEKYGVEVVAAVLGAFLIKEVKRLNQLGVWHRDLKTENVMLRCASKDLLEAQFILIDLGFAHVKNWDAYSDVNDHLGLPGTIETGGGTYKYYPHFDKSGFKFEDEFFAVGMIICDFFGFLKNNNNEVKGKIETSNLSSDMKKALLTLAEYHAEDRDPDLALEIFEDIIKKAKNISEGRDELQSTTVTTAASKAGSVTKYEERFSLEDVMTLIKKGKYEKAVKASKNLKNNSLRAQRIKAILSFLNDSNSDIALLRFSAISDKDIWSAYFAAILTVNKVERGRLLQKLYSSSENNAIIHPLVAWNLLDLHKSGDFTVSECVLKELKTEATKVNPEKVKFKKILEIAVEAA